MSSLDHEIEAALATTLWFVRHGETDHNVSRIFQGHLDTPLNERGTTQAAEVAGWLKQERLDVIYTSDLARAADTARAIASYQQVDVTLVQELREIHYGVLQGVPYTQFRDVLAETGDAQHWGEGVFASFDHVAPPGGESRDDLRLRLGAFVERLEYQHPSNRNENVLIVAHGGTLSTLLPLLLDLPPSSREQFRFDNCSVSKLVRSETGSRLLLNNEIYW